MDIFDYVIGFDWDQDNITKNWYKHSVYYLEAEEIFFNKPLIIAIDVKHSINEKRYYALGITNKQRYLFIVFTIRKSNLIRIISARDMNKNERKKYNEKAQEDS
jgi:uncharacterized DUF497 family protein